MADIANLKYQLETVTTSLAADPQNTELQNLQRDLGELIRLTEVAAVSSTEIPTPKIRSKTREAYHKQHAAPQQPAVGTIVPPATLTVKADHYAPPSTAYKVNQLVEAKWTDGKYYPATIQTISGNTYSVAFKKYGSVSLLTKNDIRLASKTTQNTVAQEENKEPKRKKAKTSIEEHWAKKEAETKAKQSNWKSFATGTKGKRIGVINEKSIFKSPAGNAGRVGVVGSHLPPTEIRQLTKHKLDIPNQGSSTWDDD